MPENYQASSSGVTPGVGGGSSGVTPVGESGFGESAAASYIATLKEQAVEVELNPRIGVKKYLEIASKLEADIKFLGGDTAADTADLSVNADLYIKGLQYLSLYQNVLTKVTEGNDRKKAVRTATEIVGIAEGAKERIKKQILEQYRQLEEEVEQYRELEELEKEGDPEEHPFEERVDPLEDYGVESVPATEDDEISLRLAALKVGTNFAETALTNYDTNIDLLTEHILVTGVPVDEPSACYPTFDNEDATTFENDVTTFDNEGATTSENDATTFDNDDDTTYSGYCEPVVEGSEKGNPGSSAKYPVKYPSMFSGTASPSKNPRNATFRKTFSADPRDANFCDCYFAGNSRVVPVFYPTLEPRLERVNEARFNEPPNSTLAGLEPSPSTSSTSVVVEPRRSTAKTLSSANASVETANASVETANASVESANASVETANASVESASAALSASVEEARVSVTVDIPSDTVSRFVELVKPDTRRNVETCGWLVGRRESGGSTNSIDYILLPPQKGDDVTCESLDELRVLEWQLAQKDLVTLGWIHTHPRHSCFLSAIDLHHQCSFQIQDKSSIAIVYSGLNTTAATTSSSRTEKRNSSNSRTEKRNPSSREKRNSSSRTENSNSRAGIFRLTEYGLTHIKACKKTGFHPHNEATEPLYGKAENIKVNKKREIKIIDFRNGGP